MNNEYTSEPDEHEWLLNNSWEHSPESFSNAEQYDFYDGENFQYTRWLTKYPQGWSAFNPDENRPYFPTVTMARIYAEIANWGET